MQRLLWNAGCSGMVCEGLVLGLSALLGVPRMPLGRDIRRTRSIPRRSWNAAQLSARRDPDSQAVERFDIDVPGHFGVTGSDGT